MTKSGKQPRPARILMVASGPDAERILSLLVSEGHLVEATRDAGAAVKRLAAGTPVEMALVGGLSDLDRVRVLAAARTAGVWCAYLRTPGTETVFSSDERSHLIATIDSNAPDARIASTIRTLVRALRERSATGRAIG
jgi:hypothetical protein